jgi:hypothetical protein
MIRVQAYIVGRTGDVYHVETLTEGEKSPREYNILAKSEDEAAMTAIRRAEETEQMLQNAVRLN